MADLARENALVAEVGRLRAEVARLTRELAREKEQHELTAKAGLNMEAVQRQRADTAVNERDALRTLVAQLVGALRGLEANVSGVLTLGGGHISDVVGHTNVACVRHWLEQARTALAAAAPYLPPDRPRS